MKLVIESNLSRGDLEELSRILEAATEVHIRKNITIDSNDYEDSWVTLDTYMFPLNDTVSEGLSSLNLRILGRAIYDALKES